MWRGVVGVLTAAAVISAGVIAAEPPPATAAAPVVAPTGLELEREAASEQAKRSGKRIEVKSQRTESQRVYADPNGKFTMELDAQRGVRPNAVAGLPWYPAPGAGWTKVFKGHRDMSYWNGANDDGFAKLGRCDWPGCRDIDTARSYWQFNISALHGGAQIHDAELNLHLAYATSCAPTPFEVWQTDPISPGTTWDAQPNKTLNPLASPNVAHGYSAACPPNNVGIPVHGSIVSKLSVGSTTATFMAKAASETDKNQWKKFDGATLLVQYNWPASKPTKLWSNVGQGPSLGCSGDPDQAFTYSPRPTLRANVYDPDRQNVSLEFEWHEWGKGAVGRTRTAAHGINTTVSATIPAGHFKEGSRIGWRVRATDGISYNGQLVWSAWAQWCGMTVDTKPPGRPGLTSTDYPEGQLAGYVGKTGAFTATSTDPDVIGYQWALNFQDLPIVDLKSPSFVPATNGRAIIRATPPRDGDNELYVRAVDRALNVSDVYQKPDPNGGWVSGGYEFAVGSATPPPVGHWPLEGGRYTPSVPDVTAGGRHGTVSGMEPGGGSRWISGRDGDGLAFDATESVTTTGGAPVDTANTFTVTAWARMDRLAGYPSVVSMDSKSAAGFQLQATPQGKWAFAMFAADTPSGGDRHDRVVSSSSAQLGVWTHLTGRYDSGSKELRLYVNGALAASGTHPSGFTAAGPLTIGRSMWNGKPVDFWPGSVDDVRIFDRLLADGEIATLANTPTAEEVFLPFDEGTGTTANDVSGNYTNGRIVPGTTWGTGAVGDAAVVLDGVNGEVPTAKQAVRTDRSFTVTARVKLDAAGTKAHTIVSQDGPLSSGFSLQYVPVAGQASGRWAMFLSPTDSANPSWITVMSADPARDGEWVHLGAVYDAAKGEARLYVNGYEHVAPARPSAHVGGNLVLGRAKLNKAAVSRFKGAIDDVHVYSGVLTREQLQADHLSPVTSRPNVLAGQFNRYVSRDGRGHFFTNGPVPADMRFEGALGTPAPAEESNTRMLYSCSYERGQFSSADPACEGRTRIGDIGLVYKSPPDDAESIPIYRCAVPVTGDHFNTTDENCEGDQYVQEGLLGHALAYWQLIRYERGYGSKDRLTTTNVPGPGYRPAGAQGMVSMKRLPSGVGLYSCADGTDEFVTDDATCEGKTKHRWVGDAWPEAPTFARQTARLFACEVTDSGDRFTSLDAECEGETVQRPLGYVITRL